MPNTNRYPLFRLIKTLTKSEKRHFRLYANRTMGKQERKFMVLFDIMDKLNNNSEAAVIEKLPGKTTKSQFSNLKRHLYKQLLTSLRLTYINKQIDIEIREQLDFARILYSKGLYMESLRLLERIKGIATEHHQDILHLEIIEFQKLIESRHITRSRQVEKKMERLLEESSLRSRVTQTASEMVNLHIQIQGYFIVNGFAVTKEEVTSLNRAWKKMQPVSRVGHFQETFFEQAYRYQSYLWYRYIQLDFRGACTHALEWVTLFRFHKAMQLKDPDLYLRSLYYLLVGLFLTDETQDYDKYLEDMNVYLKKYQEALNPNSQHVSFVYQGLSLLNQHFLKRDYDGALATSKILEKELKFHHELLDEHRLLLFYYKFAAAAFGCQQYEEALGYLHPVLYQTERILRKDMDINARLLELLCLYETQDYDRMSYRLISFGRSVVKSKVATPLQLKSQKMLRGLLQQSLDKRVTFMQQQLLQFKTEQASPNERLFIKYLNIIEWMEGKC